MSRPSVNTKFADTKVACLFAKYHRFGIIFPWELNTKAITYQRKYSFNQSAEFYFTPCRWLLSDDKFREDKASVTINYKKKQLPLSRSPHFFIALSHLHLANTRKKKKIELDALCFHATSLNSKIKKKPRGFLLLSAIRRVSKIYFLASS